MMAAGSLVGFGLALVAAIWAVSLALGASALLLSRMARRDPALERAAVSVALVAPPILGAAAVMAILVHSFAAAGSNADHCGGHGHHLHLCVAHGAAWAANAWAVAALAAVAALMLARAVFLVESLVRGSRAIADLRRVATETDGVFLVPSDRLFVFTAGIRRGATFASSAAWRALGPDERAAAVAHERAHQESRDLLRRSALAVLAIAGAPLVGRRMLSVWDSATERLRDRDAAAAVGDETSVASALVALARAGSACPAWSAPLAPADELSLRVASLFDERGPRIRAGARLAKASGIALAAAIPVAFAVADPLHHLLETVLGVF
jgi:Zn-dependent protease with chaperone function